MDLLICPVCKEKYRSTPVVLPCGWTVCDKHLKNDDLKTCASCKANHSQTNEKDLFKFPVNKSIDLQLKLHETYEILQRTLAKYKNFKVAYDDPYGYIDGFFERLLKEISNREEEVIISIREHFALINKQVTDIRNKYKKAAELNRQQVQQGGINPNMIEKKVQKLKRINAKKLEEELLSFQPSEDKTVAITVDFETNLMKTNERIYEIEKILNEGLDNLINKESYQLTALSPYISYEKIFGELEIKENAGLAFMTVLIQLN